MLYRFSSLTPIRTHLQQKNRTGLFQITPNSYLFSCLHGGEDGSIEYADDADMHISVTPFEFRMYLEHGCGLLPSDIVIVTPCFPAKVIKRYGTEFSKLNIIVIDDSWDTETGFASIKNKASRKDYSVYFGEYKPFETACNNSRTWSKLDKCCNQVIVDDLNKKVIIA